MGMTEFKTVIGIWLLAQIFFVPLIIIDNGDVKIALAADFIVLALLIIMYFGLKLIGV